jgi:ABC-type phosphate transport system auxiliary subunit
MSAVAKDTRTLDGTDRECIDHLTDQIHELIERVRVLNDAKERLRIEIRKLTIKLGDATSEIEHRDAVIGRLKDRIRELECKLGKERE